MTEYRVPVCDEVTGRCWLIECEAEHPKAAQERAVIAAFRAHGQGRWVAEEAHKVDDHGADEGGKE